MIQQAQAGDDNMLPLGEKALLASVWDAIQKPEGVKTGILQRVIAFCNEINASKIFAGEKPHYGELPHEELERKKEIDAQRAFHSLIDHIKKVTKDTRRNKVEVRHVDGKDNAQNRRRELDWLRDSVDDPHTCRIISNARCLSEGVDVPALDGVVFLNPRKSVIDVVQAVGRVMRKAPGKKYGHVILPVGIPAGIDPDDALNDNKYFKTAWQVISALRSHDPKLTTEINTLSLGPDVPIGTEQSTSRIIIRHAYGHDLDEYSQLPTKMIQGIRARLLRHVGDEHYYDKYGERIGIAASTIESRLRNKIEADRGMHAEIHRFHTGLQEVINESVTFDETVRTIAQHMVLSRVFDLLFSGEFTSHNPISATFNDMIQRIGLDEELEELEDFYKEVQSEIEHIQSGAERQNFIKKIYGNFFASVDKKGTEKHGIVFTPVEVIDFILNSVQYLLKDHFGTEFNDRAVKVLEPFAGTGTFLTRLLESGHIHSNMYEKYRHDLHASWTGPHVLKPISATLYAHFSPPIIRLRGAPSFASLSCCQFWANSSGVMYPMAE